MLRILTSATHGGKFPPLPPPIVALVDIDVALRCILPSRTVIIWYHNYTRLTTLFFLSIDLLSARFEIPRAKSTPSRFSPSEPEHHTICPTTTTLSLSGRLRPSSRARTTGNIRARLPLFAQVRQHLKISPFRIVLTFLVQAPAVLSPRTITPSLINSMVCETVLERFCYIQPLLQSTCLVIRWHPQQKDLNPTDDIWKLIRNYRGRPGL
jgi:hypothetical protein